MLVRAHAHEEHELMKWMMLLALAGALTLAFATGIAGASELRPPMSEPALLPSEVAEWALPMGVEEEKPPVADEDVSLKVWRAIDAQHHDKFDEAIMLWSAVQLPCDAEVWKHVALGQAYLANGEVEEANAALAMARKLEPKNAVVHYFLGVLRLQQAWMADEWNDAERPRSTILVAHTPDDVVPNTRSMYQLAATMELEDAIKFAPRLHSYKSLVPDDWPTAAAMAPMVHDLLLATRADNFAAKAHNMLGDLYLQRGSLEQAEQHMDEAVAGGVSVVYGYTELAEAYENGGRHSDAMRAYMKAAQEEPGKITPLRKAWENLLDSML
jgi:tetratricopeptide (TPR) repeat protein